MNTTQSVSLDALRSAAANGIITHAQLDALLQSARATTPQTSDDALVGNEGDEQLRFVRSFGDIFIAIGVALALGALGIAAGKANVAIGSGLTILAGAGLAEWLVGKKRLALPGIMLVLGMTVAGGFFLPALLGFEGNDFKYAFPATLAGGGAAAVAGAFYWRHRLPYALALIGAAIAAMILWSMKENSQGLGTTVVLCGLVAFGFAMWFDRQDRARAGRLSDCGFWLHILAAPLITHGFVSLLGLSAKASGSELGAHRLFRRDVCGGAFH